MFKLGSIFFPLLGAYVLVNNLGSTFMSSMSKVVFGTSGDLSQQVFQRLMSLNFGG